MVGRGLRDRDARSTPRMITARASMLTDRGSLSQYSSTATPTTSLVRPPKTTTRMALTSVGTEMSSARQLPVCMLLR